MNDNEKIEQTFKSKITSFRQLTKEITVLEENGNKVK